MVDFNFKTLDLDEQGFKQATEKQSRFLRPGSYHLTVNKAEYSKQSEGDPTWAIFKLILSNGGKKMGEVNGKSKALDKDGKEVPSMYYNLLVPTSRVSYNKPGMADRAKVFPFQRFREFMGGLGETIVCTPESLGKVIPKWFKDASKLVGQTLQVDVGYSKNHLEYVDGTYEVHDVKGKKLIDDAFPTRTDAEVAAAAAGITLQDWPEITKVYAKETNDDTDF
jgi:hypothetical protein